MNYQPSSRSRISKSKLKLKPYLRHLIFLLRRYPRQFLFVIFAVLTLDAIFISHSGPSPSNANPSPTTPPQHAPAAAHKERIFIASLHWNGEALIRAHWGPALLDLVHYFGADNIYISILEGGSFDDAKGALRELDLELEGLGVGHSVVLDEKTHQDEVEREPAEGEDGWVVTSRGRRELRRVPYLAGLRNRVMSKLEDIAQGKDGERRRFDKVLWLNDVIFTTEDIITLLNTNDGHYAAACSLDFSSPPLYYDTFALRDSSGAATIQPTYPYFLSSPSRSATLELSPIPVQSCWNGIVAFDAAPFYGDNTHLPLKFRGLPDTLAEKHLEASECCLIHADNYLSNEKGVWMNPNVRVGYNEEAYNATHPSGMWPSRGEKVVGMWKNRVARWTGWMGRWSERIVVRGRIKGWEREEGKREVGGSCAINEMQVLVENGWKHL